MIFVEGSTVDLIAARIVVPVVRLLPSSPCHVIVQPPHW